LAEWLFEDGIGESRAILVEDGAIVEAALEWPGELRLGTILPGRLGEILVPGRRGIVETARGRIWVEPLAPGLTQGARVRVEIVREPLAERGGAKLAKGLVTDGPEREGPALAERVGASRAELPARLDRFEEAGWSELLEEARSGRIRFPGGELLMSLTPAMTLFDVDGILDPEELAVAGAAAAARAIRRLGIGGSIGVDLPTVAGRTARQRAAEAVDALLPKPFERTAVNGFGFLQLVRRRERPSLAERLQWDPAGAAARALLRMAERQPGSGRRLITAAPAVAARLEAEPGWIEALGRRIGAPVALRSDPARPIWGGDVHASPN
jgi:hypothetical protein